MAGIVSSSQPGKAATSLPPLRSQSALPATNISLGSTQPLIHDITIPDALNELHYFVAFSASGLVILIALSVIYFEIVNKSTNWPLFAAKILMFFLYFILMYLV